MPHVDSIRFSPAPVLALHCSGGGAGQWRALADILGPRRALIAPEHYGCESTGPWTGAHAFTLADEAQRTIEIIDRNEGSVHLVGHSYGGGVALHVAVERPERVASLTLYEPTAFHLLRTMGARAASALSEVLAIAARTAKGVTSGNYRAAAIAFVEYWSGRGAWTAMRPPVQAALTRWMPKAPLDFRAAINEPTPASAYARFTFPVLVMRGERAPSPTRLIADALAALVAGAQLSIIGGAGHMGPLTHASEVNTVIARHIADAESESIIPSLPALAGFERPNPGNRAQATKGLV